MIDRYYKLVPEASVLPGTRAIAKQALKDASGYWDLDVKPGLWWIMPARGPGPDVVKVRSVPITGFCRTGRRENGLWAWDIFVVGSLSGRETFETICHETAHLYCIEVGFESHVTRDRRATETEEKAAQEAFADRFAKSFTKFNYPN